MSDAPTIQVRYSCRKCGIKDREVTVLARTTEDVVEWVQKVMVPALGIDHRTMSPNCLATSLDEVKIPMDGSDKIGGAVLH